MLMDNLYFNNRPGRLLRFIFAPLTLLMLGSKIKFFDSLKSTFSRLELINWASFISDPAKLALVKCAFSKST